MFVPPLQRQDRGEFHQGKYCRGGYCNISESGAGLVHRATFHPLQRTQVWQTRQVQTRQVQPSKKKQHYWRGPTSCPTETGYKNPEVCGNGQEGSSGAQCQTGSIGGRYPICWVGCNALGCMLLGFLKHSQRKMGISRHTRRFWFESPDSMMGKVGGTMMPCSGSKHYQSMKCSGLRWTTPRSSRRGKAWKLCQGTDHESDVCALAPGRATLEEPASGDRMTTPWEGQ